MCMFVLNDVDSNFMLKALLIKFQWKDRKCSLVGLKRDTGELFSFLGAAISLVES